MVEILLKHATNDKLSNDVKQNAAICLAKLATSDERYRRNRNNYYMLCNNQVMAGVGAHVTKSCMLFQTLCKIVEIKIGGKTRFENLLKQLFHSPLLDMK